MKDELITAEPNKNEINKSLLYGCDIKRNKAEFAGFRIFAVKKNFANEFINIYQMKN